MTRRESGGIAKADSPPQLPISPALRVRQSHLVSFQGCYSVFSGRLGRGVGFRSSPSSAGKARSSRGERLSHCGSSRTWGHRLIDNGERPGRLVLEDFPLGVVRL